MVLEHALNSCAENTDGSGLYGYVHRQKICLSEKDAKCDIGEPTVPTGPFASFL